MGAPSIHAILFVNRSRDLAKLRQAYELSFVSTAEMMRPNCDVRFFPDSGPSERTHSRFGWPWNFESRRGWIIETEQRLFGLSMGANRETLRPRFVIKTMSAAIAHTPDNLLGLSTSFDRDHLNSHRHRLVAFKATNNLREIDHFCDMGILSKYFSN
jgi:hypothetical protein